MDATKTMKDRADLHFSESVKFHFLFLTELGFNCKSIEPTYVRYESGHVFVNVYHGRTSYEIGVEIGWLRGGESSDAYGMEELCCLKEEERNGGFRNPVATTTNKVQSGVLCVSEKFKEWAWELCQGDENQFESLRMQRKIWAESFEAKVIAGQLRSEADEAFRFKDFEKAVQLYEEFQSELTEIERRKLQYARKRISE